MVVEEILRQLNATGASFAYSYYRAGGGAVPRRYHNKIIGLPMAWL